jgi:hypothetical protein
MKIISRLVLSILLFSILVSFSLVESGVFICKGPSSKVYHKSDRCKGLSRCSTQVFEITMAEAKKLGRRACKIEYR